VDQFLPVFVPRIELNPATPFAFGQMSPPGVYMEMRHSMQQAMQCVQAALENIEARFASVFGRAYGPVEAIACEDAEIILVLTGTVTATGRQVLEDLRRRGEKVGVLKIRLFRPFPGATIAALSAHARKIAVLDRNIGFGVGGIFAQELRAALYQHAPQPPIFSYIAGLGGRDITPQILEEIYFITKNTATPEPESVWIGLNKELEPHDTP
jgi:pyruvate/2-oxoacid:ferredoxin oxidoreductase alpha subunit